MTDIFRRQPGSASVIWFHRSPRLSNQYCLYCSRFVGEGSTIPSDKEHLIGRNMVPTGSFGHASAFNFIFRACVECNTEKAALEDHVSAVTLLTSPGRSQRNDVNEIAQRKAAKSFDPRLPGQPVGDVRHEFNIKLGSMITMGLTSGAQLDPDRVWFLAFRHVQGLFSLATSSNPLVPETTRLLPDKQFGFFGHYPHQDWGNPQLLEISRRARPLPRVVEVTTADGFFRCALRRVVGSPWFWALEWNKSLRLTGWIGDSQTPPKLFQKLPPLQWMDLGIQEGARTRAREEIPLNAEDDVLFDLKTVPDDPEQTVDEPQPPPS